MRNNKTKCHDGNGLIYVSLFSGCGGFDLGFSQAGYSCAGAIDIDKVALAVHQRNIAGETYYFDLSKGDLPQGMPEQVDVVIAGSPCQGFSTLGKRKLDDPRNQLLVAGGRAALALRPKVFIAENVLAVKSGAHQKYWESLSKVLIKAGYETTEIVVDSRDHGLAQSRRRIFLLAWNTSAKISVVFPYKEPTTIKDALDGVTGLPNHEPERLIPGTDDYLIAKRIPRGHKLSNVRNGPRSIHTWEIPEVFGKISEYDKSVLSEIVTLRRRIRVRDNGDADPLPRLMAEERFGESVIKRLIRTGYLRLVDAGGPCIDLCNTFNGKFRRLTWDGCSPTVDTRFCSPKYCLHPDEHRGFSVREAARLQGFPDDFIFTGTSHDHILVGNAVPPPLAFLLADFVRKELLQ